MANESALISGISAAIALVSMFVASRQANRANASSNEANRIQEAMLRLLSEQDEGQKKLALQSTWDCTFEKTSNGGTVRVKNLGPAKAQDFRVEFNDKPANRFQNVRGIERGIMEEVPVGMEVPFYVLDLNGSPRITTVTVRWQDPAGLEQEFKTILR